MTEDQKNHIAQCLISTKYSVGDIIVAEGEQADSIFILKTG